MSVSSLRNGVHLSISALAVEFGCARETVRNWLTSADVQPSGQRGGYPVYRLRDAIEARDSQGTGRGRDPEDLKPFERRAYYQAEREKLHLQTERGDVVPAIEVEQQYARLIKLCVQPFEIAPDTLERDVGLNPIQAARLERLFDEAREAIYLQIVEDGDDESADRSDEKRA